MAPKARSSTPSASGAATPVKPAATPAASTARHPPAAAANLPDAVAQAWTRYLDETPQRVKFLDVFLAFLVVVGALQFVYCVLAGNFPFNAFLAGFSATVGQFVLTASLRIQTNPENKDEFRNTSQERAFADFVLGSLILHFFCINFVN